MKTRSDHVRHFEKDKEAKPVAVFDYAYNLIAIFRSVTQAGECTGCSPQSVSTNCSGRTITSGGLYFRYLDTDRFEIGSDDLGVLTLQEFDNLSGNYRKYKATKACKKEREKFLNK